MLSAQDKQVLTELNTAIFDALNLQMLLVGAGARLIIFDNRYNIQGRSTKDLDDIDFILKNYSDDERIYAELIDEIANGDIEYLDAPIYLLGQDIRRIFRDETMSQLNSLLEKLVPDSEDDIDDSPEYRLKVLQRGIKRVISG